MNREIWRDVLGYEGLYQASNFGNIKSLIGKGRILKPRINKKNGRKDVILCNNEVKRKHCLVHRLVLIAFEGYSSDPEQNEVNHIDGNMSNNNLINLEWNTRSQNQTHCVNVLGKRSKAVDQFDMEGNYLSTFNSLANAARFVNGDSSAISKVLRGKIKHHKGYFFKLSENKKAPID